MELLSKVLASIRETRETLHLRLTRRRDKRASGLAFLSPALRLEFKTHSGLEWVLPLELHGRPKTSQSSGFLPFIHGTAGRPS